MTGLLGREQGAGQGLAKRSHFIRQGSPFAPPPLPSILPPCHALEGFPLPAHSFRHRGRSRSAWTAQSIAVALDEDVLLRAA